MVVATPNRWSVLYETDETAWLEATAQLVREKRFDELDFQNLSEYLDDMARRDRREVGIRLTVLIAHVLKWSYQPAHRSGSWRATIEEQRQEVDDLLESGTLQRHAESILAKSYAKAIQRVVAETGLDESQLPAECPYTLEQLLEPQSLRE